MKLTSRFSLLILSILFINSNLVWNLETNKNNGPKVNPDPPANPSDAVFTRIEDYIAELAEEKMKSADLMAKKKIAGALPDGFAQETIDRALETRQDKSKWKPILNIPTQIYRTCVFPSAKVNYVKWCNNNFFGLKQKADSCLYNFCQVCCDHLAFIFQTAAQKNIIGELLQLNQEQGTKAIKDLVDKTTIFNCKSECKAIYPIDLPQAKVKPPRDPELGTEKKPAVSCIDIKKWGSKTAKSGVYWIELGSKGPQKVFCDMETDKGGWTLFFNYVHQPGQELLLNENKIPNDLKTNSHMYLENAGFTSRDVKEVRFLCTERLKTVKKYWHFKTVNKDVVRTAMKGDQSGLKINSFVDGYAEIRAPLQIEGKYTLAIEKNQIDKFDFVGKNPRGGFTTSLIGSNFIEAFWTVKGDNPVQDIFECGTKHRSTSAGDDNPSMVFSHHSVWFRGNPPNDDDARERYMNNIAADKKN